MTLLLFPNGRCLSNLIALSNARLVVANIIASFSCGLLGTQNVRARVVSSTILILAFLMPSVCLSQNSFQAASCENIIKYAFDQRRGLNLWAMLPKIGFTADDPILRAIAIKGSPVAEEVWRYLNDLPPGAAIASTDYFAVRFHLANASSDLWGRRSDYASFLELFNIGEINTGEKLEGAAEKYLVRGLVRERNSLQASPSESERPRKILMLCLFLPFAPISLRIVIKFRWISLPFPSFRRSQICELKTIGFLIGYCLRNTPAGV